MLRRTLAALLGFCATGLAHAQEVKPLEGEPWECKAISLVGAPDASVTMALEPGGGGLMTVETEILLDDEDTLEVLFEAPISWRREGKLLSFRAGEVRLIDAYLNGGFVGDDALAGMAAEANDLVADFYGDSSIDYISEHALVMTEEDTSISCWR